MVIFSHSFPVALGSSRGNEPLNIWTRQQASFGAVAVNLFFFISGLLITASWLRSKSVPDYFMKRVLRIYPGFIVAMGFSAIAIWACCPEFRAAVHPVDWGLLFLRNLLLLDNSCLSHPGIFAGNPFPTQANTSLWTIPVEFLCYLSVLIVGLFGFFMRRRLVLGGALVGYALFIFIRFHDGNQLFQCWISFLTGAAVWVWQDKIPLSNRMACGCVVVLLATSQWSPWFSVVFPIAGGYCVLWLAYMPKLPLANWAEKTDLSYGVYLYAFPVQQMLAKSVALRHPLGIFILAAPITLILAWLSWNLIEKRFLAMKSGVRKRGLKQDTRIS